jgi:hypothetical protein
MTATADQNEWREFAGSCRISAFVLTDCVGGRTALFFLHAPTEKADIRKAADAGLTRPAGVVGLSNEGEIVSMGEPGLEVALAAGELEFVATLALMKHTGGAVN